MRWNLNLQRELPWNTFMTVAWGGHTRDSLAEPVEPDQPAESELPADGLATGRCLHRHGIGGWRGFAVLELRQRLWRFGDGRAGSDADTWYLLGRTKYNENNFGGARTCFERSLALHPRNVEAENNLGLGLKELDENDRAAAAFQQAIDWQGDKPTDAQPFFNLGSLQAEQGSLPAALASLQRAAALAPDNPSIQEKLGDIQLALHNLPAAQRAFEQAVTLAPTISPLHFKLGQVYRRLGQADLAQKEFAICQKLNSTHSSGKAPNPPAAQPGRTQP